ncbi:MAG TPA: amidohydrolase family protein [Vicinamibacteria bacterium]|nr:amidohydrolase family protein [Vicinamibacteria bacterium]
MRIISADSHTIEPHDLWLDALGDKYGDETPRVVEGHAGREGLFFYTGKQYARFKEQDQKTADAGTPLAGRDPVQRVAFQRKAGITAEVLYPTLGLSILHSSNRKDYREVVRDASRVYNDWLGDFISHAPQRLIGAAMIPMDDVVWACSELDRVAARGFRTPMIHAAPPEGCPPYRDPSYDPFWARVEEMGLPVTLHIVTGRIPDPMACHTKGEWEEGPTMFLATWEEIPHVLASDFIFGTILDRFPRLKIVTAELELSWIPHFMRRIDMIQGVYSNRLELPALEMKASEYLRTRVWHGLIDEKAGVGAIAEIGYDQVVWGSDFPHTISVGVETEHALNELFRELGNEERIKVVADNAAALFQLT